MFKYINYDHIKIEKKWQKKWEENKSFKTLENDLPKKYILDMFPYPSGQGLHVGHPLGYIATDIISRYYRMNKYKVLHPMGWDAFGLPAEQFAIESGKHPKVFTENNIQNYKKQISFLGLSYDWDKEIDTSNSQYYKWTQWIFMQLYKKGLAELKDIEVNWCEKLGTVLANEEVLTTSDGKMVSERGNHPVTKKPMKQWVLKITHYAERLLEDLDLLDWPEGIKLMQRNWIGKSVGATVKFKVDKSNYDFEVFTTRPDTLFGATYCVLAPENELVLKIMSKDLEKEVLDYIDFSKSKTDLDRTELNKEKTGLFIGSYAINPVNNKKIPIYIADYVLNSYGTGAIMAVPAHDQRDYEFAKKYNIEIIPVLDGDISNEAYTGDGLHINSEFLNGLNKEDSIKKILEFLEDKKIGYKTINYKLRDWLFSRQRYWGEPFPIVHYEDGSIELIDESELPLLLPELDKIAPSGTGEGPLANATDWLTVVRKDGVKGRRETNTMPQWAGSCWYYIGYILKNDDGTYKELSDPKVQELVNKWLPVDLYVGGAEHAVLHLLYSRFWHKVLYDCGIVNTKEPFQKLFNQGMLLGENNEKMSKSRGNVVNPDDVVISYGADAFRLYEMSMGPLEAEKIWNTQGLEGSNKFLDRFFRMFEFIVEEHVSELDYVINYTIKKVTEDIEKLAFNTAIAQMRICVNEVYKLRKISKDYAYKLLVLLNPFAPHLTEEINEVVFSNKEFMVYTPWPKYDESKLILDEIEYIVQVNGKLRDKILFNKDASEEEILELAKKSNASKFLENVTIVKVIFVKNKLINIVVK